MAPIVLVGMMGAGKTSVGRNLAARRGAEFVDVDAEVEAVAGRTMAEIWAEDGEQGFRVLESAALAKAVARVREAVVATGGGVVVDPANRSVLAGCTVVWLRARADTLSRRVGSGRSRPLLADRDPAEVVRALTESRGPLYSDVATVVVDVDDRAVDEVVDLIGAALAPSSGGAP